MARILLAEDVTETRLAVEAILLDAGHAVTSVRDGAAAIERFAQGSEADGFDLLVLDIWMPGQSGLDVLKAVRARHAALPVVLMSGGGPGATLEQATAIGDLYKASAIIYKPFEDDELLQAIEALLPGPAHERD